MFFFVFFWQINVLASMLWTANVCCRAAFAQVGPRLFWSHWTGLSQGKTGSWVTGQAYHLIHLSKVYSSSLMGTSTSVTRSRLLKLANYLPLTKNHISKRDKIGCDHTKAEYR